MQRFLSPTEPVPASARIGSTFFSPCPRVALRVAALLAADARAPIAAASPRVRTSLRTPCHATRHFPPSMCTTALALRARTGTIPSRLLSPSCALRDSLVHRRRVLRDAVPRRLPLASITQAGP